MTKIGSRRLVCSLLRQICFAVDEVTGSSKTLLRIPIYGAAVMGKRWFKPRWLMLGGKTATTC